MDTNENVQDRMAALYRKIERNEITEEELSKNVFVIGISELEVLSHIALKRGNQKVYQTIVFACNDAISKIDKNHQK